MLKTQMSLKNNFSSEALQALGPLKNKEPSSPSINILQGEEAEMSEGMGNVLL